MGVHSTKRFRFELFMRYDVSLTAAMSMRYAGAVSDRKA